MTPADRARLEALVDASNALARQYLAAQAAGDELGARRAGARLDAVTVEMVPLLRCWERERDGEAQR
jgi:hypothetical protein